MLSLYACHRPNSTIRPEYLRCDADATKDTCHTKTERQKDQSRALLQRCRDNLPWITANGEQRGSFEAFARARKKQGLVKLAGSLLRPNGTGAPYDRFATCLQVHV